MPTNDVQERAAAQLERQGAAGRAAISPDGSYDLYFAPTPPLGRESNWVETIPGKAWFPVVRIYGPLQPWFDQTWRLNDIEPTSE